MASFNKIIIVGNVTKDIELSYIAGSQTAVAIFGIATNRKWKGQDGQDRVETCFFEVNAFAKQAETINKYVKRGDLLLIEGHMKYESWAAQDGSKRNKLKVVLETFQFMPKAQGKKDAGGETGTGMAGTPNPDYNPDYVAEDDIPF